MFDKYLGGAVIICIFHLFELYDHRADHSVQHQETGIYSHVMSSG